MDQCVCLNKETRPFAA